MMSVPISGVFRLEGRGTVILVPADQGEVHAGCVVSIRGLKDAVIQEVQSYDRPPSWGLLVAADVAEVVEAQVGEHLTIRPRKDA